MKAISGHVTVPAFCRFDVRRSPLFARSGIWRCPHAGGLSGKDSEDDHTQKNDREKRYAKNIWHALNSSATFGLNFTYAICV
jgi:hypothetical protein